MSAMALARIAAGIAFLVAVCSLLVGPCFDLMAGTGEGAETRVATVPGDATLALSLSQDTSSTLLGTLARGRRWRGERVHRQSNAPRQLSDGHRRDCGAPHLHCYPERRLLAVGSRRSADELPA
jgi:hypothetical protein